jgi:methylmalonyl-CoA mutase C-terminal domain/subunit
MTDRPIRVLIAKPGLDGHDVGAKVVALALRDAGMEVVYTGLHQTPERIARAAQDEAVDVVGLSVLSGAHVTLTRRVAEALRARGLGNVRLVVGGVIPKRDEAAVREAGAHAAFPTGADFGEIVDAVRKLAGGTGTDASTPAAPDVHVPAPAPAESPARAPLRLEL